MVTREIIDQGIAHTTAQRRNLLIDKSAKSLEFTKISGDETSDYKRTSCPILPTRDATSLYITDLDTAIPLTSRLSTGAQ